MLHLTHKALVKKQHNMTKKSYEEMERDARLVEFASDQRIKYDTLYAVKATEKDVSEIKTTTTEMAKEAHSNHEAMTKTIDAMAVIVADNSEFVEKFRTTVVWAWRTVGAVILIALATWLINK